MQSVAFAARLLPGQTEAARVVLASCQAGARKEAYQDARGRAGIIREAVWIQPAPGGMWPWSTWRPTTWPPRSRSWGPRRSRSIACFRDDVGQVHGIALEDGFTAPGLALDIDISRI